MATPKYDSEDLLDDVLDVMVGGGALNARVAAIDAEKIAAGKPLDPVLKPFADDAYYCQAWSEKILNNSPSIFYGIEDITTVDGGGAVAKTYKLFVEVILVESVGAIDSSKRIARYNRALEELFVEFFAPSKNHGAVKIETVRPLSFKVAGDSDDELKVGGISISVSLV